MERTNSKPKLSSTKPDVLEPRSQVTNKEMLRREIFLDITFISKHDTFRRHLENTHKKYKAFSMRTRLYYAAMSVHQSIVPS